MLLVASFDHGDLPAASLLSFPPVVLGLHVSCRIHAYKVDVGRPVMPREVRTVAICAGSGGSVLDGVDADVYFTGEMSHVRPFGFLYLRVACAP